MIVKKLLVILLQPQLITKYGYTAETHGIETEDGYLLSVHRISGSKKYPPTYGKPVVFLQHGLLASSATWILNGPTKGLGIHFIFPSFQQLN